MSPCHTRSPENIPAGTSTSVFSGVSPLPLAFPSLPPSLRASTSPVYPGGRGTSSPWHRTSAERRGVSALVAGLAARHAHPPFDTSYLHHPGRHSLYPFRLTLASVSSSLQQSASDEQESAMFTKLAFDIPLIFASLVHLFLLSTIRASLYILSYPCTIFSLIVRFFSSVASFNRLFVNTALSGFSSNIVLINCSPVDPVNRFLRKSLDIGYHAKRSFFGDMRQFVELPSRFIRKVLGRRPELFRWTHHDILDTSNRSKHCTDKTQISVTASITTDDTPPASDTPSSDDSTKLNVLLESSSGSFVDVPITPPTTPTDVLSNFACTLSPATPANAPIPLLSPPTICTTPSSEGPTLVTEDSEEKLKSAAAVSTPKRRPFAELPVSNTKNNSKSNSRSKLKPTSEPSPSLLKTSECKFQTSSSDGKENQPPPQLPKSQQPNLQTKGAYYRKDSFMNALKMDLIPIGEGGFGQVFRAKATEDRTIAVKLMQRGTITQEIAIVNEVQALRAAKGCKWIVELVYFQAAQEQALIALSYLPGGDMHSYWERSGFCLDLKTAQFYTAQLILAIHDLHSRGIIHRDIKLENMMLDAHRNLKLVDFGLAQVFNHVTVSEKEFPLFHQLKRLGGDAFPLLWATSHNPHQTDLANGTEGYAPPEVWKCQSHSFGIDYFAMGCVLHMLITGNAPFEFDQVAQDYSYDKICVDKTMDIDAFDFLTKVLAPSPMNRLNVRRMKLHPVFRDVDWNGLAAGSIEAPLYSNRL
ncbi:hypothetical protein NP233_g6623 [Leucocoprinus birnbaumii]|uniref:Protein kinase domain-containing protein n=1 Tax=Leucocoprinus birnbaumii TaxID=56174 RepID=A0AAD5VQN9_9AGAR|nr:hypothetical protein NP233_g6623 [Leucocoprinus birnbaumii]